MLGAHPPVVLSRLNPPYAPFYRSPGSIRLLGGIESLPPPRLITRPNIAPDLYLHRETNEAKGEILQKIRWIGVVSFVRERLEGETSNTRGRNDRVRSMNTERSRYARSGAYTPLSSPENRSSRRLRSILAGEGGGGRIILARLP